MKKLFIYSMLVLAVPVTAQTEKGRILLGGSVGFSADKDEQVDTAGKVLNTTKYNNLNLTLRGGYFVADNVAVGLLLGFDNQKNTSENPGTPPSKSTSENKNGSTSFGLFGRFYTPPVERRFALFGQLDVYYSTGKRTNTNTFVDNNNVTTSAKTRGETSSMTMMISPGVAYFLSDHIALEATFGALGFTSGKDRSYDTKDKLTKETKSSTVQATLSPSTLRLGITFYFGGGDSGSSTTGGK